MERRSCLLQATFTQARRLGRRLQSVSGLSFELGGLRPVEVAVSDVALSSDAGLLPVRPFDEKLEWNRRFADGLVDERDGAGAGHVGESADALSFREREPHLRPVATA